MISKKALSLAMISISASIPEPMRFTVVSWPAMIRSTSMAMSSLSLSRSPPPLRR